jgi:hypothetical protein
MFRDQMPKILLQHNLPKGDIPATIVRSESRDRELMEVADPCPRMGYTFARLA